MCIWNMDNLGDISVCSRARTLLMEYLFPLNFIHADPDRSLQDS